PPPHDRSQTTTFCTPPLVSLPIDIPCPLPKWLWATTMWSTTGGDDALMAMLSSPVVILLEAMTPLVDAEGSTPSVLGEVAGVLMVMPHTLNPLVRSIT